jgi:multiple sugar transport system permease protein
VKGKKRRRSIDVRRIAAQLIMALASLILLSPLIWMASTSFKPKAEVLSADPKWIPSPATISNFSELFARSEEFPILRWLFNSFLISCSVTMLVLLVTSMAAFAFARLKFRGRDILFMVVISTMIIPGQVILIPAFLIVQKLGWFNTYFGLIVPGAAGAFGVFLLRQFFRSIPVELEEAAVADGAGLWTIYFKIVLPLAKPALATLAIFTFMGSWNDFVWPLIVTNEISMRTLPVGLMIFQGRYSIEYGLTMAAAMVCSLPVIIAFIIFQKRITEGIALTGIKG